MGQEISEAGIEIGFKINVPLVFNVVSKNEDEARVCSIDDENVIIEEKNDIVPEEIKSLVLFL